MANDHIYRHVNPKDADLQDLGRNDMVLRTTQKFVNWVSCLYFLGALAMFIFLWAYIPVLHLIWTNLLDFAFNIMYVVIGALLWPGTLLAILVCGF
ncbi:hypothetical protein [Parasutterella excrementihominis]|nr:hypothetical protein [Parasutterella excrementihominis]